MGVTNALLIRTAYGWDEATVATSDYRREALYGLGSYTSAPDVQRVAQSRLALIAEPRHQYDADHVPSSDSELAYHGYGTGDRLPVTASDGPHATSERVVSLSVSESVDDGRALTLPTLNDVILYASPIENFAAMLRQASRKMFPGTGGGDWPEAQPVTPPGVIPAVGVPAAPNNCCGYAENFGTVDVPVGFFNTTETLADGAGGVPPEYTTPWCSTDMGWSIDVIDYPTINPGDNSSFGAAIQIGDNYFSFFNNQCIPADGAGKVTWQIDSLGGICGSTASDIAGPIQDYPPQPGDHFEFTGIGNVYTLTRNGVVMLQGTAPVNVYPTGIPDSTFQLGEFVVNFTALSSGVGRFANVTFSVWCGTPLPGCPDAICTGDDATGYYYGDSWGITAGNQRNDSTPPLQCSRNDGPDAQSVMATPDMDANWRLTTLPSTLSSPGAIIYCGIRSTRGNFNDPFSAQGWFLHLEFDGNYPTQVYYVRIYNTVFDPGPDTGLVHYSGPYSVAGGDTFAWQCDGSGTLYFSQNGSTVVSFSDAGGPPRDVDHEFCLFGGQVVGGVGVMQVNDFAVVPLNCP